MAIKESKSWKLIQSIPSYALRETLEGYLQSVEFAAPDIFRENGVKRNNKLLDDFLFCAVIRRLWSILHTQNWLLRNSLNTSEKAGVGGYFIGSKNYSYGSDDYAAVTEFYDDFANFLEESGISAIVKAHTLSDALAELRHATKN